MIVSEGKLILKRWRICIIDDSPEDRAEIRRMLLTGSERRISFVEMGTASVGIRGILADKQPPDCVILDYNLPEMFAPELLENLRGTDGNLICPVVVVTGGANREDGKRALRAGALDYIGKDWTNPFALSRSVENACETWAMARELREQKEASRLLSDRESFRGAFGDATRDLVDEQTLKRKASDLLGRHLNANRILYGEIEADGTVSIGQSYVDGVAQIDGRYCLNDFGPQLLPTLLAGKSIVVADIRIDGRYSAPEKLGYSQMQIVSNLAIPILKNGRLAAILGVHQNVPRTWSVDEIAMAKEIGELTWAAVEHARSEKKLQAKELQLSQMLQIMPSFSALLSGPTFVFQMANQSYYDLIGRGAEIIGKPLAVAIPEIVDQPFPALLDAVYRTGKPFEAKAMAVTLPSGPGGSMTDLYVDFVYLPLRDTDGKISSIFVHGVDRTKEVKTTQLLLEQDVRKDEFLATLAHELRNPLAPIRNSFQLLKRSSTPEVLGSTLPVMERQLGALVRLIDDLLDVSRISSGKIVLKRQRVSIQDIATAALETSQPLIDSAGHNVVLDWPSTPIWLDADPMRLAQVFSNLLTNSAKYMKRGGHIRFAIQRVNQTVEVNVVDDGVGIPMDLIGQVFDMFTQVNRTLDRAEGGLGVGLSLVKTLIEMHGGTVRASSDGIDLGSEFKVTLPVAQDVYLEPKAATPSDFNPKLTAHTKPLKILVVDDNVDAAQTMAMLLGLSNHNTRTANSGQEALEIAEIFKPSVVFLDIGLPSMNGYEVAKRLQAMPVMANTKLIALTGWGTSEDIKKSKNAGFYAHLTKPVDPDEVDALLAQLAIHA
jgi:signal transduction histidine kinase/response regulator RpfG family c-di-GMP phosphodiesterase